MTKDELAIIRNYIVENIMRNPGYVFSSNKIRDKDIDLIGVIAGLYNLLHEAVTGEEYNYMFHWTNKVGGWVEDEYFNNILKESKNGAAN